MGKAEKIQKKMSEAASTMASLLKVALMSKAPSRAGRRTGETLLVLGNGPSLRTAIDEHAAVLGSYALMSVNFAPITPDFFALRPRMHILADGGFFAAERDANMQKLWDSFQRVDWDMTLYVPTRYRRSPSLTGLPANIEVKFYNLTPVEGNRTVSRLLYSKGLGMPRPRNVMIPAIMTGIREGFGRIVLLGADHSWSRTLWVNDDNRVVTVQPHFYKDNDKEKERVESLYKGIRLHQIYESFAIAFRSYFGVKDFAESRGVEILNATPGSFIDAFPRIDLASLQKE